VVTVNSLPMVLPDMVLCDSARRCFS